MGTVGQELRACWRPGSADLESANAEVAGTPRPATRLAFVIMSARGAGELDCGSAPAGLLAWCWPIELAADQVLGPDRPHGRRGRDGMPARRLRSRRSATASSC